MLEEIETEAIRFALAHYRGQLSQMARKLGSAVRRFIER